MRKVLCAEAIVQTGPEVFQCRAPVPFNLIALLDVEHKEAHEK